MAAKPRIYPIYAPADTETVLPVLSALEEKGHRLAKEAAAPGKSDVLLLFLSERFSAEETLQERFFSADAPGRTVIPVNLDGSAPSREMERSLFARNTIPARGRSAGELAERIASAEVFRSRPGRLPRFMLVAAAVVLLAGGLWLWRASAPKPDVPEPTPEPTATPVPVVIPPAAGVTEADLAKIKYASVVGDRFYLLTEEDAESFNIHDELYYIMEDDGMHWYGTDGTEFTLTRYADLDFFAMMPNLEMLELVLTDVDSLPDLSGLENLQSVNLADCPIESAEWLAGTGIQALRLYRVPIRDYSPISRCEKLTTLEAEFEGIREADLSGLCPPRLHNLYLGHGPDLRELDLSGLANCEKIYHLDLRYGLPIRDLSFLAGSNRLEELRLEELPALRDVSALKELKRLKTLDLLYCLAVDDYTPIAGCEALERIELHTDGAPLRDASFLTGLTQLSEIHLYGCDLRDMNFLSGCGQRKIILGFAGNIEDYSGLEYVKSFSYLHVNPRRYNARYGDLNAVLPHLQGAAVDHLMLYGCDYSDVDWSALPDVTGALSLCHGNLERLDELPESAARRLLLEDLPRLGSLDGLGAFPKLNELRIESCPRLTDFGALEGRSLVRLDLKGLYVLPELGGTQLGILRLENLPELEDLHLLDAMDESHGCSFELVGLDSVWDLTPLERLHGPTLTVQPQLAEQAEDLVKSGNFHEFHVEYPEEGWQRNEQDVELLSLEELDTLPPALLRHVRRLCVAGSEILDRDRCDVWSREENGKTVVVVNDWESGQERLIREEGPLKDLTAFLPLTGLEELELCGQPLTSLEGLEELTGLRRLTICASPRVTDASPAFALQGLWGLDLDGCGISSLQGIQNLPGLTSLNINSTQVADLSPLAACDFTEAERAGGLDLHISNVPVADYSPLAAVPMFSNLDINDAEARLFLPCVENADIRRISACSCFEERYDQDNDALFADFIRSHPTLRELWIPWNRGITDLTPLLELPELEYVRLSRDMEQAIASLEGKDTAFQWEIEG